MTMTANKVLPNGAGPAQEEQSVLGKGATGAPATEPPTDESDLVVDPQDGDEDEGAAVPDASQGHTEVGPDGSEATEEFAEATAEQLSAPAGDGSALQDLRGIEGFEEVSGIESAGPGRQGLMPDAGVAAGDGQEFAFLAPLLVTVGTTLASKLGPVIAGRVFNRLSDRAKRVVSRPPRGAGSVPTLVRFLNEARSRVAEGGAEAVDESAVDEVVHAMEVIIGTDDRVRATSTRSAPWNLICALRIEFPTGAVYRGTGFFIGPRTVATAGHCVYLHNQGGWARRVEVIPGCNGTDRPYGSTWATGYRSTDGWVKNKASANDYGALFLPADAFGGRNLGSFGFADFPSHILLAAPAVLAGFPGDKPFAELWGTARRLKGVTAAQLQYDTDSVGGQSGAGVYITRNDKRYVVGIHNYGASTGNTATRITAPVARNLLRWSKAGTPGGTATT